MFREMDKFPPEDVDIGQVPQIERDLEKIKVMKNHYQQIMIKREQVCPKQSLQQKTLELQQLTLKVHELTMEHQQEETNTRQEEKQEENLVMAETEANTFLGECSLLGDIMMEKIWTEVEDETVAIRDTYEDRKDLRRLEMLSGRRILTGVSTQWSLPGLTSSSTHHFLAPSVRTT